MSREIEASVLASGLGFTEGPTIREDGSLIVVSIDQGRIYRIADGQAEILAETGGGPNGATSDDDDAIYIAQNGGNWMRNPHPNLHDPDMSGGVQRIDERGTEWLSKRPLAPNDLCFGPDGMLYVTDPTRDGKYDDGRIWRVDPASGEATILVHLSWFCNGIGFGADDQLYVASTGARQIVRLDFGANGDCSEDLVCQLKDHAPDGFAFDADGNIVVGALARTDTPGEVQVWTGEGELLDRISLGDGRHYTNVALTGDGQLVVCDSESGTVLLLGDWGARGLALYPRRHRHQLAPKLGKSVEIPEVSSREGSNGF